MGRIGRWSAGVALLSVLGPGWGCTSRDVDPIGAPPEASPCDQPGAHGLPTPLACESTAALLVGDAAWEPPPFAPPGNSEPDDADDGDDAQPGGDGDGDDGWAEDGGVGFINMPDGGGVAYECDLFAQDCPDGEKCMPWANDGGSQWNATRCAPIDDAPGAPGDPCAVEGSGVSGIDDCALGAMCWDVDTEGMGTCAMLCGGTPDNPLCDSGSWCWIGNDGVPAVCLPDAVCEEDGVCQCMCGGTDPDCGPDRCSAMQRTDPETIVAPPVPTFDEDPAMCPETAAPVEIYMSNDDSNSQASPILVRRTIREGRVVSPDHVRIHEFMNYYDFSSDVQCDDPAKVALEMRRTDADAGEFTLMLYARGQTMTHADRPRMNLVFSLDTSGSMEGERIALLQETMVAVAASLRAGDIVSAVTWSDAQNVVLDGHEITGADDPALLAQIDAVSANGGTNLHAGLTAAYQLAADHFIEGGLNRVVLVSDGGANVGVTDLDVISSGAADSDGDGIYLVGVGVGPAEGYRDDLMDAATDAGKGAYVFVDDVAEAHHQFEDHFLSNVMVAARNVQTKLTLPWYFGVRAFHGEEYSGNPSEVEPQHLAPNDVMAFHQIVGACDPDLITECDAITARVDYTHPLTGVAMSDELTFPIGQLVEQDAPRLRKADAIVGYAKSLIVIGFLVRHEAVQEARLVAQNMHAWLYEAAEDLADDELFEVAELMGQYATFL